MERQKNENPMTTLKEHSYESFGKRGGSNTCREDNADYIVTNLNL